jgi:hypothetical protein
MAYTILNTDGTILTLLADGTVDNNTTSLTLVGKNYSGYGTYFNDNFVTLLANSANVTTPRSPIKGQVWYDTSNKKLKIYDPTANSIWTTIGGAILAGSKPAGLPGDVWFDTFNSQFYVNVDGNNYSLVGPLVSGQYGKTGWYIPTDAGNNPAYIQDTNGNSQKVSLLKNNNQIVGLISNSEFEMSANSYSTYITPPYLAITTSTTSTTVAGLTIYGDIAYTGRITSKYYSLQVNIDFLNVNTQDGNANRDVDNLFQVTNQNNEICSDWLTKMFPPTGSSLTSLHNEAGVPVGSEARVLCQYGVYNGSNQNGLQVRRYVVNQFNAWVPYPTVPTYTVAAPAPKGTDTVSLSLVSDYHYIQPGIYTYYIPGTVSTKFSNTNFTTVLSTATTVSYFNVKLSSTITSSIAVGETICFNISNQAVPNLVNLS